MQNAEFRVLPLEKLAFCGCKELKKNAQQTFAKYLAKLKNIIIFVANIGCAIAAYLRNANAERTLKLIYYGKEERYYAIQDSGRLVV